MQDSISGDTQVDFNHIDFTVNIHWRLKATVTDVAEMSLSFGLLSYPALHTQPFAVKGHGVMLHFPYVGAAGKLNT